MVAIKAHEADRAIARPDPQWRIWLLYGPDAGLISERAATIANAALGKDSTDPFRLVRIEGDDVVADPARLLDEASTIGLFGGDRVIRVSRTSKQLAPAIEPLLRTPPAGAVIIIEAGELSGKSPLVQKIGAAACGVVLPCYVDDVRGLEALVDTRLREAGLAIDRDARQSLIASLGSDRLVSRQEIEKLIAYVGDGKRIEIGDILACVGDSAVRETDTLADAVFTGDLDLADQAWARLMAEGAEAGVVAGALCRHAAQLLAARLAVEAGQSREAVLARWRFPFPRKRAIETALGLWPARKLTATMAALMSAAAAGRRQAALGEDITQRAVIAAAHNAKASQKV